MVILRISDRGADIKVTLSRAQLTQLQAAIELETRRG